MLPSLTSKGVYQEQTTTMLTERQQLEIIRSKCCKLIELAQNKTNETLHYHQWNDGTGYPNARAASILGFHMQGRVNDEDGEMNIQFVQQCCEFAMAGWASTIHAIDAIMPFVEACESSQVRSVRNYNRQKLALANIIDAWGNLLKNAENDGASYRRYIIAAADG